MRPDCLMRLMYEMDLDTWVRNKWYEHLKNFLKQSFDYTFEHWFEKNNAKKMSLRKEKMMDPSKRIWGLMN